MKPLLTVENLAIYFLAEQNRLQAVESVSFSLFPGEAVGLVGESGCGKSLTAQAILGLIAAPPALYDAGKIHFNGEDLRQKSDRELAKIRGKDISMIFQDPMTALNPVLTIGDQIAESLMLHCQMNKTAALAAAVELLQQVGIPSPEERILAYPHQFSGGMRQRAMIAMALACRPKLLLADEPTTALDVTIQAQILALLKKLQQEKNTAILFISHDLGAVATLCQRVLVMYAGTLVEEGAASEIFHHPGHPYTKSLLAALPRLQTAGKQKLTAIAGQPPHPGRKPTGCAFHPRCPDAMEVCAKTAPPYYETATTSHKIKCWLEHPLAQARRRRRNE